MDTIEFSGFRIAQSGRLMSPGFQLSGGSVLQSLKKQNSHRYALIL